MAILKGSFKWVILPIVFPVDQAPVTRVEASFYGRMFVEKGAGGLNDYWSSASHGNINLDGSSVRARRLMPVSIDAYRKLSRYDKIARAAELFSKSHDPKKRVLFDQYYGIVVVATQDVKDAGSVGVAEFVLNGQKKAYGTVLINSDVLDNLTFIAHEMGHGFGLDHSFDDSGDVLMNDEDHGWHSAPGEYYDSYDLMSAMNVHTFVGQVGSSGPMLNAPTMARMGWLQPARVNQQTAADVFRRPVEIRLAPLESSGNHGSLMAVIQSKRVTYAVEYRSPQNWDRGIPRPGVLIHRVEGTRTILVNRQNTNTISNEIRADRSNTVQDWQTGETFTDWEARIQIRIVSIDASSDTATVEFGRAFGKLALDLRTPRLKILKLYQKPLEYPKPRSKMRRR